MKIPYIIHIQPYNFEGFQKVSKDPVAYSSNETVSPSFNTPATRESIVKSINDALALFKAPDWQRFDTAQEQTLFVCYIHNSRFCSASKPCKLYEGKAELKTFLDTYAEKHPTGDKVVIFSFRVKAPADFGKKAKRPRTAEAQQQQEAKQQFEADNRLYGTFMYKLREIWKCSSLCEFPLEACYVPEGTTLHVPLVDDDTKLWFAQWKPVHDKLIEEDFNPWDEASYPADAVSLRRPPAIPAYNANKAKQPPQQQPQQPLRVENKFEFFSNPATAAAFTAPFQAIAQLLTHQQQQNGGGYPQQQHFQHFQQQPQPDLPPSASLASFFDFVTGGHARAVGEDLETWRTYCEESGLELDEVFKIKTDELIKDGMKRGPAMRLVQAVEAYVKSVQAEPRQEVGQQ
ncbi:hypothetical protein JCM8097_005559 [Rhodosporidiobolus ruineniae]